MDVFMTELLIIIGMTIILFSAISNAWEASEDKDRSSRNKH